MQAAAGSRCIREAIREERANRREYEELRDRKSRLAEPMREDPGDMHLGTPPAKKEFRLDQTTIDAVTDRP